jgi:hypothetical protein
MPARPGKARACGHAASAFSSSRAAIEAAILGALLAQDARQLAGIDAGDGDHVLGAQVGGQGLVAAKVRGQQRQVADHQAGGMDAPASLVLAIDAVLPMWG